MQISTERKEHNSNFFIKAEFSEEEMMLHENILKAVFNGVVEAAVKELLDIRREELLKKLNLEDLSEAIKTEIGKAFAQKALDNLEK